MRARTPPSGMFAAGSSGGIPGIVPDCVGMPDCDAGGTVPVWLFCALATPSHATTPNIAAVTADTRKICHILPARMPSSFAASYLPPGTPRLTLGCHLVFCGVDRNFIDDDSYKPTSTRGTLARHAG